MDISSTINEITEKVNRLKDQIDFEIRTVSSDSYKDGFNAGFDKGFELGDSSPEIEEIDWDSIKKFAKWCYIHGIDFSYMAKGTDTIPFTERVINKFKEEIEVKDK